MERLHPGVYIQEVSSGVRPIEGVSTSTTAFLGKAARGPIDRVELVTNFTEFEAAFGGFLADGFLAQSALQFFNNGGRRLHVARVAVTTGANAVATASVTVADRQGTPQPSLQLAATSPGAWGNGYTITVAPSALDPGNQFRLTISRGTDVVEVLDNLSMNPDSPTFVQRAINGRSRFVSVPAAPAGTTTVGGTSVSAATPATTLAADKRSLVIDVNGDGPRVITIGNPATTGVEIAARIQAAVAALAPLRPSTPATAYSAFTATFASNLYTLTSGVAGKTSAVKVSNAPAAGNAANLLRLGVGNGGTESTGAAPLRPALGSYALGGATVSGSVTAAVLGKDGDNPTDTDYITALSRLDGVPDVNILAVPGVGTQQVVDAGANYCAQRQDCFFIGDMAVGDDTPAKAQTFINSLAVKTSYAAVYFPWIKAVDPTGASQTPISLPPSGYLAGIYARTDARRGVWKAPAGTEANLGGAVGLAAQILDSHQDVLNPIGANAIRFFPSSGIVVWGARTLATLSDPEYRYVPVRRLTTFIERSIYDGIQWAVFEPNDEDLWASLRLNIGSFMMNTFRAGAFQGATASQAFFVKCDEETNPQSEINAGVVNVLVGFAPVKPAEFIVIKISQKAGDSAI